MPEGGDVSAERSFVQVGAAVLLTGSSVVMKQRYGTSIKRKRKFADLYVRLLWKMLMEHL